MIVFPNAKINIGLHVTSRRPDGFHNIETIFFPIPLCDAIEATPADNFSFSQSGILLDSSPENNLVIKALRQIYPDRLPNIALNLIKGIPFGAGLGGGSSDAAFMLKMINEVHKLGFTTDILEEKAARVGADCPFFIRNRPAYASGTGNLLEPVALSLAGYHITLVKPPFCISTAEAYAGISPSQPACDLRDVVQKDINEWRNSLRNDFEPSIVAKYPQIARIKQILYDKGALYASMSGSGSTVYGLFSKEINMREIFPNYQVFNLEIKN
ncbi:MAG: 4-(cytidine 5'-diphospho)-2-C-methyl-D-erythritol kinase [Tannerellaceae bacterium]|jgi:4-diphosphocytidyl-2-C-methyl-D-erythritol kinase|nr:4-(cytidine 5'-diphospho)-2-C-methyl-D-erythritol kinase [Tannerellaceae bacterium]